MAVSQAAAVQVPIPISKITDRYLLFDVHAVTYLRRYHNICGVLIGVLPQIPQQNIFSSLPLQLLPEEVQVLVEQGIAYVVDDAAWHARTFSSLKGEERRRYLASMRSDGTNYRKKAEAEAARKSEIAQRKRAANRGTIAANAPEQPGGTCEDRGESVDLFGDQRPMASLSSPASQGAARPHGITRTATSSELDPAKPSSDKLLPLPAKGLALYRHLHANGYFITPGLRFGGDYTVYPGDPLRFHSHFLAVGYDWDQEIPLMDIVGGGRLGTGVKKGFMIGGAVGDGDASAAKASGGKQDAVVVAQSVGISDRQHPPVRVFCIEWGGM